jgi:hypothetical protein
MNKFPDYWNTNKLENKFDVINYNKLYFKKIYKQYKKQFYRKKHVLKEFNKFSNMHINIFNIMKTNNNDELVNVEKKIYSIVYLIKLKYEIIIENNIYTLLGKYILSSHILNNIFGFNIDNGILLLFMFNNIYIINPTYLKYLNDYKLFIIHNINIAIYDNDNIINKIL